MHVKRKYGQAQPGISWGPFTARIPFYHLRTEWPEFFQGLVVGSATALALVPLMQSAFGLSFEEAVACSMIHSFILCLGFLVFGEPFAPGWITPALPIVLAFVLGNYAEPSERFQAMTALSIDFAVLMLLLGATGLGKRITDWLPVALKAGIILGASLAALKRVFLDDIDTFMAQPLAMSAAMMVSLVLIFSKPFERYRQKSRVLSFISNLGLLPGFLIAAVIGWLAGEIHYNISWGFLLPPVGDMWAKVSPFAIGWPSINMFLAGLPLAFIAYIILFGDIVTGVAIIETAEKDRSDEKIERSVSSIHYSIALRNFFMALVAPFFTSQGALWAGVQVIVTERWRQGREKVDSLFSGISSYYTFGLPVVFFILPLVTALAPMMNIALSLTFVLTGFACAYVAIAMPKTDAERGVMMLTGVALVVFEAWVGLLVGLGAAIVLVGFKTSAHEEESKTQEEAT